MAVLRIKTGNDKGKVYDLKEENLVIGRDRGSSIQLLDQGASRQHAEVFRIGELFFIRDLESRNHTYVNTEEVQEVVLRFGDQIQIGSTVLVFEDKLARFQDSQEILIDDRAGAQAPKPSSTLQMRLTETIAGSSSQLRDLPGETPESRRLSALVGISQTIGSERNLSRIIAQAAAQFGRVIDADNVFVFLVKGGNGQQEFELLGRYDRDDGVRKECVSRTIIRDCLENGRSILTSDAGLDARYNAMASVVLQSIRSVICAPISGLGKDIGVLYASNAQRSEAFNSEDLELASAVAVQLATTIQLLQGIQQAEKLFRDSIRTLVAAVETRDPFNRGRAERLASICLAVAKELGRNTHECRNAWLAGMLYDIGSIPLSDRDREAQFTLEPRKNHYARELLKDCQTLAEVLPAITQQKERWDGSGGPEGKKADEIHPLAQILGLAYEFDALLEEQQKSLPPPKEPKEPKSGTGTGTAAIAPASKELLKKVMQWSGKPFNEQIVKALLLAFQRGRLFGQESGFFELPG